MLARIVKLPTYIREVHDSDVGWFTGYPEVYRGLLNSSGQIAGKYLELDHDRLCPHLSNLLLTNHPITRRTVGIHNSARPLYVCHSRKVPVEITLLSVKAVSSVVNVRLAWFQGTALA